MVQKKVQDAKMDPGSQKDKEQRGKSLNEGIEEGLKEDVKVRENGRKWPARRNENSWQI